METSCPTGGMAAVTGGCPGEAGRGGSGVALDTAGGLESTVSLPLSSSVSSLIAVGSGSTVLTGKP